MSDPGAETDLVTGRSTAGDASTEAHSGPLPGFELLEQLGHGATTVVHRASRSGDDSHVAVKMLRDRSADATWLAATYRREAALLARVAHPLVTAVYETGEVAGRPYVVLELVDGVTLARTLEDGPLPESQTLQIAIDTADALSAVHRMRLVHRDIKPGNLMISETGRVKLIDFDLATWTGGGQLLQFSRRPRKPAQSGRHRAVPLEGPRPQPGHRRITAALPPTALPRQPGAFLAATDYARTIEQALKTCQAAVRGSGRPACPRCGRGCGVPAPDVRGREPRVPR